MDTLGDFLRQQRTRLRLNMNDVYEKTGLTDSRLSRIEHGEINLLKPFEIRKLAELYDINILQLYLMAGYITEQDISDYQFVFKNAELLNDAEHRNIQTTIDLFTQGRTGDSHDIQVG